MVMKSHLRINSERFGRHDAFSFYEVDLENQIRIKKVLKIFSNLRSKTINNPVLLDIGCGSGEISQKISASGFQVHGMDISQKAVKRAKHKGIQAIAANAEDPFPYKKSFFDYIFAGEIIEHLFDTKLFFSEVQRVLKINGIFVITTPNLAHLPDRFRLLRGVSPTHTVPFWESLNLHIRHFTPQILNKYLREYGFEVELFCSTIVVFQRNGDRVIICSKLLADLFPFFGNSLIMVARKLHDFP